MGRAKGRDRKHNMTGTGLTQKNPAIAEKSLLQLMDGDAETGFLAESA